MKVWCSFYNNAKRMAIILDRLSTRHDTVLVAVKGTLVKAQNTVKCLGQDLEYLVVPRNGGEIILATNSSAFAECNKQLIDYDLSCRDNIYIQALNLCIDKAIVSGNKFQMDCAMDGCVITATGENSAITYKVKAPKGDCLLEESSIPEQIYRECKGIRSFTYTVVTDTSEKEVTVRKGQLEVFREISHYVNRALLFTKFGDSGVAREYCITPTGCCELVTKKGETSIVKVPYTKMIVDTTCALTALDVSLDVLLRSRYFTQSLGGY